MTDKKLAPPLWKPRSVAETQAIYAEWADHYDQDVAAMNYATPMRVADAVRPFVPTTASILDFGCGTGLSGLALAKAGYALIDGADINKEMLKFAYSKYVDGRAVYRNLSLGAAGHVQAAPGDYMCIVATGVISLGAAPPDLLRTLLKALAPQAFLAFSYNDPTLSDANYASALDSVLADGTARLRFREHGPHLSREVTGSDVIVLQRE